MSPQTVYNKISNILLKLAQKRFMLQNEASTEAMYNSQLHQKIYFLGEDFSSCNKDIY